MGVGLYMSSLMTSLPDSVCTLVRIDAGEIFVTSQDAVVAGAQLHEVIEKMRSVRKLNTSNRFYIIV